MHFRPRAMYAPSVLTCERSDGTGKHAAATRTGLWVFHPIHHTRNELEVPRSCEHAARMQRVRAWAWRWGAVTAAEGVLRSRGTGGGMGIGLARTRNLLCVEHAERFHVGDEFQRVPARRAFAVLLALARATRRARAYDGAKGRRLPRSHARGGCGDGCGAHDFRRLGRGPMMSHEQRWWKRRRRRLLGIASR